MTTHTLSQNRFWSDPVAWRRASLNTLTCLIGCSIGDFGAIILIQTYRPQTPIFLTMGIAMACGIFTSVLFEALLLKLRERFAWGKAISVAISMSFMSMLAMEFSENATDYLLTGGRTLPNEGWYWIALGISLIVGFLVPLPYNYYKLKRHGKACH